ncbi:MAG TPA: S-methyl-5'-thioadenosine phosphorylase [Blastocatellia bacterium]|nr:S-methyl-5'-thioadenosine phosphorylase [Blastocatellia bacterium]
MENVNIGIIGGSGLYQMPELENVREQEVETPFGKPSDAFIIGELDGVTVAFLPRHARGHKFTPTEVPYRANIYAMKLLGVEYILSVSAVGSLQEQYAPTDMVIPSQFFDRTRARAKESTFFGEGIVGHVTFAHPVCDELGDILEASCKTVGVKVHRGGTYLCMEGPAFSTKAESMVYRHWGMDIIGMTTTPEAQLAREAEMSYAVMAHVTDYDVWHESETPVTVEMVIQTLLRNASVAKQAVVNAIRLLAGAPVSPQAHAMRDALITNKSTVRADVIERLRPIVGKYFDS